MITDESNLTKLTVTVTETSATFMCESIVEVDHWEVWVKEKEGTTNAFEEVSFEKVLNNFDNRYLRQQVFNLKRATTYFGYVIAVDDQDTKGAPSNTVEFDTFPDSTYKGINPIAYVDKDGNIWENGKKVQK